MEQVIKVAKIGKSANSTDPNDFIFHSSYNTFKIVKEATYSTTIPANTTGEAYGENHDLKFTPMVTAFLKEDGKAWVVPANSESIDFMGAKAGWITTGLTFVAVRVDSEAVSFLVDNDTVSDIDVTIRYFCYESV